jgi:uncharacterized protein YjbJ (UPF0337 family)
MLAPSNSGVFQNIKDQFKNAKDKGVGAIKELKEVIGKYTDTDHKRRS